MVLINRDLLFLYSENSRAKINGISRLLKKSPQRLKYNLKRMESEYLLNNAHCIFDYSYFGQILFRVYFHEGYFNLSAKTPTTTPKITAMPPKKSIFKPCFTLLMFKILPLTIPSIKSPNKLMAMENTKAFCPLPSM